MFWFITRSVMTTMIASRAKAMPREDYLLLMLVGYLVTISIETPVLVALLSRRHSVRVRLFAGVWLTACTYPVVWLVLPPMFAGEERWLYLVVAETFAPVAECAIFWFAFIRRLPAPEPPAPANEDEWIPLAESPRSWATARDLGAIVLANLCSFGIGEELIAAGLFG
jgi:hypothetical protein